jgi:hypothetical protein
MFESPEREGGVQQLILPGPIQAITFALPLLRLQ